MSTPRRSIAAAALLALIAFGLYTFRIGASPHSTDELDVVRQSEALTLTGRDLSGRAAPLFPQVDDENWQLPMAVYSTVVVSAIVPAELAGRLSSALFGALSVGLVYFLLARIHPDTWTPLVAGSLFALTPAVVVYSRTGADAIYSVPFVVAWLIGLRESMSSRRLRPALVGAFALGVGVFTQPSAPLTMLFLLVVGLVALWTNGARGIRPIAAVVSAFVVPVSAAAGWFLLYPDTYRETFGRWVIHAAHLRYPLDGMRAFVNWTTLGSRANIYWGSFDPSWLFLDGPALPGDVLGGVAPFFLGTAILCGFGFSRMIKSGPSAWRLTVLAGGVLSPAAASAFGVPHSIGAFLSLVPFVSLVAAEGIAELRTRSHLPLVLAGSAVTVALVLECASFYAGLTAP